MPVAPQYQPGQFDSPRAAGNTFRAPRAPGLGEAIAQGLSGAGNALVDYAKAEDAIQAHYDQTQARRLAVEYQTEVSALMTEFQGQRGENAINAAPGVRQRLEELRQTYASQANSPRMQEMLAERLDPLSLRAYEAMVTHAQREQITLDEQVTVSERNTAAQNAVASYLDPGAANEYRAQALDALNHQATLMGWSDEQTALERQTMLSGIHAETITAMLNEADPDLTMTVAYFEANKDEMTSAHRNAAAATLQGPLQRRQAASDFAELVSSLSSPVATDDAGGGSPAPASGTRQTPVTGTVTNDYADHLARGSAGYDIAAAAGSSIMPSAQGVVRQVGYDADGAGHFIIVEHPDGFTTSYSHMGYASRLKAGDPVTASTVLGTVGSTGRSSGPHLHFRVRDATGKDVDPEEYLSGASPVGLPSDPRNWDHASVMAGIDAKVESGEWTFERAERARDEATRRMQSDEALLRDREADAAREASQWVIDNPNFTDINAIPKAIRDRLGVDTLSRLISIAQDNASGKSVDANGDVSIALRLAALDQPARFAELDLGLIVDKVSDGEFSTLVREQQRTRDRLGGWTPNTKVGSTFNRMAREDGNAPSGDENGLRVREIMRDYMYNWFDRNEGKEPGDAIYEDAYRHATAEVETTMRRRAFGIPVGGAYQESRPRYQNREADRAAQRNEARDILRSEGVLFPTEAQIAAVIESMPAD